MGHSLEKWDLAEAMYLAGVPVPAIAEKLEMGKSAIYEKTGKWKRQLPKPKKNHKEKKMDMERKVASLGKTADGIRVLEEVEARKTLEDVDRWKASAPPAQVAVHDELVLDRLTLEKAFASSAMRNQQMVDKAVLTSEVEQLGHAGIDVLKKHAETTKINKQNVLGGDPVIQINQGAGDEKSMVMLPPEMMEGQQATADEDNVVDVEDID